MGAASTFAGNRYRPQLLERRARLETAAAAVPADYISHLIAEIDSALGKIDSGAYGLCETCGDPIEADRLEQNPLVRFCVDHLSEAELHAHQQDLELARQIQANLLPPRDMALGSWDAQYRYQPLGVVGGDYCELIVPGDGSPFFFAVGDVAGKGVAASLLMTHLSATFRSLLSLNLSLAEVVSRANRLFCESTAPAHYATLVCGRATAGGVELCNAGHCPPLLLRGNSTERLDSTGLPLGLFCASPYAVQHVAMNAGESLVLYSDGITDAENPAGEEYREERLVRSLRDCTGLLANSMADRILGDVSLFRQTRPPVDDMTLLIVRRSR